MFLIGGVGLGEGVRGLLVGGHTSAPPETETLRRWLDNWRGLGDVVTGMNRQGYMLHLSNVDEATWRASFSSAPMLASDGFGTGPTPWRAVQVAVWEALSHP